jgi:hypothetical protein
MAYRAISSGFNGEQWDGLPSRPNGGWSIFSRIMKEDLKYRDSARNIKPSMKRNRAPDNIQQVQRPDESDFSHFRGRLSVQRIVE